MKHTLLPAALAALSLATPGAAMSQNPMSDTIALKCVVENADIAPQFSEALCAGLREQAQSKWPDAQITDYTETGEAATQIIALTVQIVNDTTANAKIEWGDADAWEAGTNNESETVELSVVDSTLRAVMANSFVTSLFGKLE